MSISGRRLILLIKSIKGSCRRWNSDWRNILLKKWRCWKDRISINWIKGSRNISGSKICLIMPPWIMTGSINNSTPRLRIIRTLSPYWTNKLMSLNSNLLICKKYHKLKKLISKGNWEGFINWSFNNSKKYIKDILGNLRIKWSV